MTTPSPAEQSLPFPLGAREPIDHGPQVHKFGVDAAPARPQVFDAFAGLSIRRKNQRQTNSCVGHGVATAVEVLIAQSFGTTPELAARMPWMLALQAEGTLGSNNGTWPHDALTATRQQGVCQDSLYPLSDTDFVTLPDGTALADAKPRAGISFQQCENLDALLTAMGTLGVPGIIAIAVYDQFFGADANGNVAAWGGPIRGYHCIVLRSYNDLTRRVRIRNSWDPWGQDGECELSYDQLAACLTEAWVAQLAVTPKPTPTPTPTPDPTPVEDPREAAVWAWISAVCAWTNRADVTAAMRASEAAVVVAMLKNVYGV